MHKDEINMIVLIPKTEERASDKEVTIKKLIMDRTENPEVPRTLTGTQEKDQPT